MEYQKKFRHWADFPGMDLELSREMALITSDEEEIARRFSRDIVFGAGGIRGRTFKQSPAELESGLEISVFVQNLIFQDLTPYEVWKKYGYSEDEDEEEWPKPPVPKEKEAEKTVIAEFAGMLDEV